MEKTGDTVTSTICLLSRNAASMRGMRQIGLVAVPPFIPYCSNQKDGKHITDRIIVLSPFSGRGTIYLNSFFYQSILANRYIYPTIYSGIIRKPVQRFRFFLQEVMRFYFLWKFGRITLLSFKFHVIIVPIFANFSKISLNC